jgi:hypothetical protein
MKKIEIFEDWTKLTILTPPRSSCTTKSLKNMHPKRDKATQNYLENFQIQTEKRANKKRTKLQVNIRPKSEYENMGKHFEILK